MFKPIFTYDTAAGPKNVAQFIGDQKMTILQL